MSNKINKIGDTFVCPFCLHQSKLDHIQFRSLSPYLANKPDQKLTQYRQQVTGDKTEFCFRNMAVTSRGHGRGVITVMNKALRQVPVAYTDESGAVSQERLCPVCHNPLPPNIGFVNTANIIVAGSNAELALQYTKKLFEVLYRDCTIEYVDFFSPQEQVARALDTNAMDGLTFEEEKLLMGKLLYSIKGSLLCEFTVTYLPLGMEELGRYSPALLHDLLAMANGMILVEEYSDLECFMDRSVHRSVDNTNAMEYLLHIGGTIGYSGTAEDAFPAAIVLTDKDYLYSHKTHITPDRRSFGNYEADAIDGYTDSVLSELDNNLRITVESTLRNNCFFSVGNVSGAATPDFENPIKWLIKSFNLKELKQKETPQAAQPPQTAQPPQATQPLQVAQQPQATQPPQAAQPPQVAQPPQATQPPQAAQPPQA